MSLRYIDNDDGDDDDDDDACVCACARVRLRVRMCVRGRKRDAMTRIWVRDWCHIDA